MLYYTEFSFTFQKIRGLGYNVHAYIKEAPKMSKCDN